MSNVKCQECSNVRMNLFVREPPAELKEVCSAACVPAESRWPFAPYVPPQSTSPYFYFLKMPKTNEQGYQSLVRLEMMREENSKFRHCADAGIWVQINATWPNKFSMIKITQPLHFYFRNSFCQKTLPLQCERPGLLSSGASWKHEMPCFLGLDVRVA